MGLLTSERAQSRLSGGVRALSTLLDHRPRRRGGVDVDGYDDGAACCRGLAVQTRLLRRRGWMDVDF